MAYVVTEQTKEDLSRLIQAGKAQGNSFGMPHSTGQRQTMILECGDLLAADGIYDATPKLLQTADFTWMAVTGSSVYLAGPNNETLTPGTQYGGLGFGFLTLVGDAPDETVSDDPTEGDTRQVFVTLGGAGGSDTTDFVRITDTFIQVPPLSGPCFYAGVTNTLTAAGFADDPTTATTDVCLSGSPAPINCYVVFSGTYASIGPRPACTDPTVVIIGSVHLCRKAGVMFEGLPLYGCCERSYLVDLQCEVNIDTNVATTIGISE